MSAPHRFQVGETLPLVLTARELRIGLGFKRTQFYLLERAGAFRQFESAALTTGKRVYSGTKLQAALTADAESVAAPRRFLQAHVGQRRPNADTRRPLPHSEKMGERG